MGELTSLIILLGIAYAIGKSIENKHFKNLSRREAALSSVPVLSSKTLNPDWNIRQSYIVTGSTVVSIDCFKRFMAGIRSIIGGHISSYESVLDRARREALLRMREEAKRRGAAAVINVRVETSQIGISQKDTGTGCAEILAYGTAIFFA